MIIQKGKRIVIPIIHSRESSDTHNRKTLVFLQKQVTVSVWNVEEFEDFELVLMRGHSGRFVRLNKDSPVYAEPMLRLYLKNPNEAGCSCEEIDGFSGVARYEGLTIKIGKDEEVITPAEAVKRINAGEVMYLNEDLSKRTIES
jgi:hypothetical protein